MALFLGAENWRKIKWLLDQWPRFQTHTIKCFSCPLTRMHSRQLHNSPIDFYSYVFIKLKYKETHMIHMLIKMNLRLFFKKNLNLLLILLVVSFLKCQIIVILTAKDTWSDGQKREGRLPSSPLIQQTIACLYCEILLTALFSWS